MSKTRHSEIPIQFGGQTRHLAYGFHAMSELEDIAGTFASAAPKMKILRAAVWAGLLAETVDRDGRPTDKTLSLIEVGEILEGMEPDEIEKLASAIMEARGLATPPEPERPTPATESPSA